MGRKELHARRRQFNRQGQPVKLATDRRHRGGIRGRQCKCRMHRLGAGNEQAHRGVGGDLGIRERSALRNREGCYRIIVLAIQM